MSFAFALCASEAIRLQNDPVKCMEHLNQNLLAESENEEDWSLSPHSHVEVLLALDHIYKLCKKSPWIIFKEYGETTILEKIICLIQFWQDLIYNKRIKNSLLQEALNKQLFQLDFSCFLEMTMKSIKIKAICESLSVEKIDDEQETILTMKNQYFGCNDNSNNLDNINDARIEIKFTMFKVRWMLSRKTLSLMFR